MSSILAEVETAFDTIVVRRYSAGSGKRCIVNVHCVNEGGSEVEMYEEQFKSLVKQCSAFYEAEEAEKMANKDFDRKENNNADPR